ncbi:hypothetical protein QMZ92_13355 [Streptomyces sp. HNM0645]|uniref:hypothetical protein n=1 Tax=Streptomyces sp. HNM0645 TaxID=2782343 RepID=UPI0024B85EF4|nr:hypothetical protein [Streptomyces sp. HNM0645]MDI9885355.1 hypothetical protein [Streptomyces sp. HNM0645]
MTNSPTPAERLALKTANAALLSRDASYDLVSTIVFALGSAQLLQSPETAEETRELQSRASRLHIAWGMARTRARSVGSAADRYAARARELQEALQESVVATLAMQMERDELRKQLESARVHGRRLIRAEQRTAELEAVLRTHRDDDRAEIDRLRARVAELEAAAGDGATRTADEDPIRLVPTEAANALDLRREESVRKMRALLAGQRRGWEDPHESPLARGPHPVPHDLPETEARS